MIANEINEQEDLLRLAYFNLATASERIQILELYETIYLNVENEGIRQACKRLSSAMREELK